MLSPISISGRLFVLILGLDSLAFTLTDIINIILTLVIAIFAVVQGISAYNQYNMERHRNNIKAISDEIEKAYAPIYAILSKYVKENEKTIEISVNEKIRLDEKILAYRCIFSNSLFDYWKKNIHKIEVSWGTNLLAWSNDAFRNNMSPTSGQIEVYKIPIDFTEMVGNEYSEKIRYQRKLLSK